MDLITTLIGVLFLIIGTAPIIYLVVKSNRKSKQLETKFKNQIALNGLNLSQQESWVDKIIGLDPILKKILFISNDSPHGELIDLSNMIHCRIVKQTEGKKEIIMKLGLNFSTNSGELYIPFFDMDTDDPLLLKYQLERVKRWHQYVGAWGSRKLKESA